MKKIAYIFLFLSLDLITKLLAEKYQLDGTFFRLIYNPNLGFGVHSMFGYKLDMNFMRIIMPPLLTLPMFAVAYFGFRDVLGKSSLGIGLLLGGMIGNYIGHFDDRGVIDFISTYYYYCNLADIFQWIGLILLMRQLYKHLVDQNRQAEEVL